MPESILLLDGDRHFRQLISRLLAAEGYHPLEADTASEATALVSEKAPYLSIADYRLLAGLDGLVWIEQMRRFEPRSRMVFLTGSLIDTKILTRLGDLLTGAMIIQKPINPSLLLKRVDTLLPEIALAEEQWDLALEEEPQRPERPPEAEPPSAEELFKDFQIAPAAPHTEESNGSGALADEHEPAQPTGVQPAAEQEPAQPTDIEAVPQDKPHPVQAADSEPVPQDEPLPVQSADSEPGSQDQPHLSIPTEPLADGDSEPPSIQALYRDLDVGRESEQESQSDSVEQNPNLGQENVPEVKEAPAEPMPPAARALFKDLRKAANAGESKDRSESMLTPNLEPTIAQNIQDKLQTHSRSKPVDVLARLSALANNQTTLQESTPSHDGEVFDTALRAAEPGANGEVPPPSNGNSASESSPPEPVEGETQEHDQLEANSHTVDAPQPQGSAADGEPPMQLRQDASTPAEEFSSAAEDERMKWILDRIGSGEQGPQPNEPTGEEPMQQILDRIMIEESASAAVQSTAEQFTPQIQDSIAESEASTEPAAKPEEDRIHRILDRIVDDVQPAEATSSMPSIEAQFVNTGGAPLLEPADQTTKQEFDQVPDEQSLSESTEFSWNADPEGLASSHLGIDLEHIDTSAYSSTEELLQRMMEPFESASGAVAYSSFEEPAQQNADASEVSSIPSEPISYLSSAEATQPTIDPVADLWGPSEHASMSAQSQSEPDSLTGDTEAEKPSLDLVEDLWQSSDVAHSLIEEPTQEPQDTTAWKGDSETAWHLVEEMEPSEPAPMSKKEFDYLSRLAASVTDNASSRSADETAIETAQATFNLSAGHVADPQSFVAPALFEAESDTVHDEEHLHRLVTDSMNSAEPISGAASDQSLLQQIDALLPDHPDLYPHDDEFNFTDLSELEPSNASESAVEAPVDEDDSSLLSDETMPPSAFNAPVEIANPDMLKKYKNILRNNLVTESSSPTSQQTGSEQQNQEPSFAAANIYSEPVAQSETVPSLSFQSTQSEPIQNTTPGPPAKFIPELDVISRYQPQETIEATPEANPEVAARPKPSARWQSLLAYVSKENQLPKHNTAASIESGALEAADQQPGEPSPTANVEKTEEPALAVNSQATEEPALASNPQTTEETALASYDLRTEEPVPSANAGQSAEPPLAVLTEQTIEAASTTIAEPTGTEQEQPADKTNEPQADKSGLEDPSTRKEESATKAAEPAIGKATAFWLGPTARLKRNVQAASLIKELENSLPAVSLIQDLEQTLSTTAQELASESLATLPTAQPAGETSGPQLTFDAPPTIEAAVTDLPATIDPPAPLPPIEAQPPVEAEVTLDSAPPSPDQAASTMAETVEQKIVAWDAVPKREEFAFEPDFMEQLPEIAASAKTEEKIAPPAPPVEPAPRVEFSAPQVEPPSLVESAPRKIMPKALDLLSQLDARSSYNPKDLTAPENSHEPEQKQEKEAQIAKVPEQKNDNGSFAVDSHGNAVSPEVAVQLKKARLQYLLGTVGELNKFFVTARNEGIPEAVIIQAALDLSHRIRSASSTHGLTEISRMAGEIEDLILATGPDAPRHWKAKDDDIHLLLNDLLRALLDSVWENDAKR